MLRPCMLVCGQSLPHSRRSGACRTSARARGVTLTKNEARAEVGRLAPDPRILDLRLIELPRHRIRALRAVPFPAL